jgi:hypothetical protein
VMLPGAPTGRRLTITGGRLVVTQLRPQYCVFPQEVVSGVRSKPGPVDCGVQARSRVALRRLSTSNHFNMTRPISR